MSSAYLKLVDELELDPEELRTLRADLGAREECEIDLDACSSDEGRQLAITIKQRNDAVSRGETKLVPMGDVMKSAREALRAVKSDRRARSRSARAFLVRAHGEETSRELIEAVVAYETQRPGRGTAFLSAVDGVLARPRAG